ncbi:hypothetical protein [Candidatus Leptofilum sp.]|uniref:hypothetical protein n=1 Tax=Candidatus Leptofilum sp. TaxID=3241576 RepID=UPI003B5C875E
MEIVRTIHGEVRWLVALIAIVVIVKFALGLIQKAEYKELDRRLMSVLVILIDINLLMGLILLFNRGFDRVAVEHATTMIIALVLAHSNAAWRKSEDSAKKFRNNLIVVVLVLALVFVGVMRIRGTFFV